MVTVATRRTIGLLPVALVIACGRTLAGGHDLEDGRPPPPPPTTCSEAALPQSWCEGFAACVADDCLDLSAPFAAIAVAVDVLPLNAVPASYVARILYPLDSDGDPLDCQRVVLTPSHPTYNTIATTVQRAFPSDRTVRVSLSQPVGDYERVVYVEFFDAAARLIGLTCVVAGTVISANDADFYEAVARAVH